MRRSIVDLMRMLGPERTWYGPERRSPERRYRDRLHRAVLRLIVIFLLAMGGFVYAVYIVSKDSTDGIRIQNRQGCVGGSERTVQQLKIDWTIYKADRARAITSVTADQRRISGVEAHSIYQGMHTIASVRVSTSVAKQLPRELARTVMRVGFHCPPA